jgi:predicted  nucleic acid-binding Zn-ribbon protein
MPTSIDPQPAENELECARCGAYFHIGLTRCPNCGVNIYEPEDEAEQGEAIAYPATVRQNVGFWAQVKRFLRRLVGKEDLAQALFSASLEQIELYDELLRKVGGDEGIANRLIAFEGERSPQASRSECIRRAIERWERDNS